MNFEVKTICRMPHSGANPHNMFASVEIVAINSVFSLLDMGKIKLLIMLETKV